MSAISRNLDEIEEKKFWTEFAQKRKEIRAVNAANAKLANEAITRLVEMCAGKTGQSYHVRALLYSLWNGRPTSLLNVVNLDRELRDDLLCVIRAFGSDFFFYDQIKFAFEQAGLFIWFIEQGEVLE